jgi:nitroreductase
MNMEVLEAIKGRRSIRKYKSDPVPEEALRTLMEAVKWAPSWSNTQCCQVIVVKNADTKSKFAKTVPKDNPALSSLSEAPVVLVFCAKKEISGYDQGKTATVKGDWLMFDTGLAVQSLCLTAHALSLGTVVIGQFDHQKVAEILEVPGNVDVVTMIPLGYPAARENVTKRKDTSEFISYDKYRK